MSSGHLRRGLAGLAAGVIVALTVIAAWGQPRPAPDPSTAHHCTCNVQPRADPPACGAFELTAPDSCPLSVAVTPASITHALRGVHLVLVGDSTSRRAAYQLRALALGTRFADGGVPIHFQHTVGGSPQFAVSSVWLPRIAGLLDALAGGGGALGVDSGSGLDHTAIVLSYSTHDLCGSWDETASVYAAEPLLRAWAANITGAVAGLRALWPASSVFVRQPIAQCCISRYLGKYTDLCDYPRHIDPINQQLLNATALLLSALSAVAPPVPALSMNWTRAPDGFDRHPCVPCDGAGTHFDTDSARTAFLAQMAQAVAWARM